MTKSELIKAIAAQHPHLTSRNIDRMISVIFDEITASLARGDRVEIRGFGSFRVKRYDQRLGRNPRTGVEVFVASKKAAAFRAGKSLNEAINKDYPSQPLATNGKNKMSSVD